MGVDCNIHLPANVRVRDVADIIGILAGKKTTVKTMNGGGLSVDVEGVKVEPTSIPEMVQITVKGPFSKDAQAARGDNEGLFCYYHFESEDKYVGWRDLNPRSTPFWCAVARSLVDFFGGEVDYNDCDTTRVDYRRSPRTNLVNCPSNNPEWDRFQKRMAAARPLAAEDFKRADKVSAYKLADL